MQTLIVIALVAAAPVPPAVKTALAEARLHLDAAQLPAAERVLRDLRQQLWLIGGAEADSLRVRVEFVLWDLRMGLHDQAKKDLAALIALASAAAKPGRVSPQP